LQRDARAHPDFECGAIGSDRLLKPLVLAGLFAEHVGRERERVHEAAALVCIQAGGHVVAKVLQAAGDRLQHVDEIVPLPLGRRRDARGHQRDQHGIEVPVELERQAGLGQHVFAGAASLGCAVLRLDLWVARQESQPDTLAGARDVARDQDVAATFREQRPSLRLELVPAPDIPFRPRADALHVQAQVRRERRRHMAGVALLRVVALQIGNQDRELLACGQRQIALLRLPAGARGIQPRPATQ
jgi:hypothetical protein